MAIYKKINGKDTKIADNGIIDHNQLANRNVYGAHSIDSIRKLPEKLTELKNKSIEIEGELAAEVERAEGREKEIEDNAKLISLTDNQNGTLTFKNYEGNTNTVRSGHLVDNTTIKEINDNSTLEVIGVKGTFTKDSQPITKVYDAEDIYDDIEATKRINIEVGEGEYAGKIKFTPYEGDPTYVQGGYLPDNETIELEKIDNQDKMVAVGLKTGAGTLSGERIRQIITSKGGYLNSCNQDFSDMTEEDVQSWLTNYAYQEIQGSDSVYKLLGTVSEDTFNSYLPFIFTRTSEIIDGETVYTYIVAEEYTDDQTIYYILDIWDKTRVINLYNQETPDTWVWDAHSRWWSNLGFIGVITDANNDSLHGLVTGSEEDYKISVNADGTMTANGLQELDTWVRDTNNNGLVLNERSSSQTQVYSADYVNDNYAPLSFVSRLYLEKQVDYYAILVNDPPEVSSNNYINVVTNGSDINWQNPDIVATRTLQADTTLTDETSFTVTLNFIASQAAELGFGAKIQIQLPNANWQDISTGQTFGTNVYVANKLSTAHFIVYTNEVGAGTTYNRDTNLRILIYLNSSTNSYDFACGYEIEQEPAYSFVQFNFSNMMIDTSQIANGSVTYPKLDNNLQGKVGKIGDASLDTTAQTLSGAVNELLTTKQDTLVNQQNIKSINNNSLLGSGNLELPTYLPFPSSWSSYTSGTTLAFCNQVNSDTSATIGKAYLGSVTLTDKPFSGNGELVVEILQGPSAGTKAIHLTLTSGDVAPYRWEYTYWNNGSSTSGWIAFMVDRPIDNTPTQNSTNLVTSGGVYTALGTKQDTITGAASTVTTNNLTANKVLVSDANGKIAVGDLDTTQLASLLVANTITWHEEDEEPQEE